MKFHYSSYWGAWSRVIGQRDFYTVEIDLTPVNSDWSRVKSIWVRAHCTARSKSDVEADTLPAEVWSWIGVHVGNDTRRRLVTCDFLPMIDWARYDAANNGGCAFENCRIAPPSEENAA